MPPALPCWLKWTPPPQETAVQEEQAAEAAEALSTVKKNLRARQVKITLAAVADCWP